MLAEIGIEFREFPHALTLWKEAGAEVDGERVRFPRGLCRSLVQATAPGEFRQHARNPRRSTIIGGDRTVLVPAYGPPFVHDLDKGRRYAALEDFRNFVKLACMSPGLHHSGGTVCEPVDVPVNKRHFDMVYSHIKYSDKPFMGSVIHPERAKDSVAMAKIVFGDEFVAKNTVLINLINANSPLTFDATMLGAATVYAENNQATIISPFLLAGAMSPVTIAGTLTQILAEALAVVNFMLHTARWSGAPWSAVEITLRIDCDLLAVSGGFSPAVHLHSQAGGKLEWNESQLCFLPAEARQAHDSAGAGNGKQFLGDCLADGLRAGKAAVEALGLKPPEIETPSTKKIPAAPIEALWRVPAAKDADRCPKQFIDFQNDTTVADIRLAVREAYRNVEHVKRYTALGFGTDQGKLGNINGTAILADIPGKPIPEVGTTTFRPAYTPVRFGAGAGESVGALYDPVRKTALHEWHEAAGAPMEVVGQWHRPWYFPRDGEDLQAAMARECLAVRNSVGIMDASTLGKIDARGPDVVEFLERIYTHNVRRMKVGRCAYGIMLGEDGMVMDDGVMARLGENRFYLTTTTGGAARVLDWLELWLQTEFTLIVARSFADYFCHWLLG